MKPYINLHGKGRVRYFWGDTTKKKIKRVFKKSIRFLIKNQLKQNSHDC